MTAECPLAGMFAQVGDTIRSKLQKALLAGQREKGKELVRWLEAKDWGEGFVQETLRKRIVAG